MATERPNIVVIMTDQHRADAMGCAGDPVVETPNLDRLAEEGVRFGRAYCQGPLCMPARASFLSERYVRDHGVHENVSEMPQDVPTFVHSLAEVGYHTTCIGKMHLYLHGRRVSDVREAATRLEGFGFAEPIETVGKLANRNIRNPYTDDLEEHGVYEVYREWIETRSYGADSLPMWHTGSNPLPADLYPDRWHGQRVARWIEEYERDEPFFLWVGFPGPHDPWDAPAEYASRYSAEDMPLPSTTETEIPPDGHPFRAFVERSRRLSDSETLTDEQIREVRRFYLGNVTLIDEEIGRIIAALEHRGMLDDTWVIYTTDHGEMLGEHRLLGKRVFYEPSVRVPLIVRPPGGTADGTAGSVIEALVEHIDVPATIREIAVAGPVAGSAGRSLLPYLSGGLLPAAREVAHSENDGFAAFVTSRFKLVVHEETLTPCQLFDLEADPGEEWNVVADPDFRAILDDLMLEHVAPYFETPPTVLPAVVPTR